MSVKCARLKTATIKGMHAYARTVDHVCTCYTCMFAYIYSGVVVCKCGMSRFVADLEAGTIVYGVKKFRHMLFVSQNKILTACA